MSFPAPIAHDLDVISGLGIIISIFAITGALFLREKNLEPNITIASLPFCDGVYTFGWIFLLSMFGIQTLL